LERLKKLLPALALVLLLAGSLLGANALGVDSVSTFYIEQTYANVPEMDIFVYALNGDGESLSPSLVSAAGVKLTLGDKKLDTGTVTMANEPICYLFALDNGSDADIEELENYKEAILMVAQNLGPKDQIAVYTMAGGPSCIFSAGEDLDTLADALDSVEEQSEKVDLPGTLTQIAADVNTDFQSIAPRKAVFTCTSAVSMLANPASFAVLSSQVSDNLNMALFNFVTTSGMEQLSLLSSVTNGRVTTCLPEDIVSTVLGRQSYLANALEIKTAVPTADGGEKIEALTLSVPTLGSAVSVTSKVYMGHSLAKPEITGVRVNSRGHITVFFNQAVSYADLPSAYIVRSEDIWNWRVNVKSVQLADDGRSALLTTDNLYRGTYTVKLHKVVSRITAANKCSTEKVEFSVKNWPADRRFYLDRFRLPVLVVLALLLILLLRASAQKQRDRSNESIAEAEHLLADADAAGTGPTLPKRWVTLYVRPRGSIAEKRFSAMVESSLMLGSDAALCDFVIEDPRVRPQHCILSVEGDSVYIQPISKNCAVYIGKERIGDAHKLNNNDSITLGGTRIQLVL
jgi:hypothetical protein